MNIQNISGQFPEGMRSLKAGGETAIVFMGQAGFVLVDREGLTYSVDVYFSDCCEREFGFKRLTPKITDPCELSPDFVLTTHAHYDHLDIDAVPALMENGKTVLYTTENGVRECDAIGIENNVKTIKRGNVYRIGNIDLVTVFCDHGNLAPDAVGFLISVGGKKILLCGDTAYRPEKIGFLADFDIDIMFVPINGAFGNLNEKEAADYTKIIRPGIIVPCHYGMFAEHGGDVGKFNLLIAENCAGIENKNLKIGDVLTL